MKKGADMWGFRRNSNPWGRIVKETYCLIEFIDTEAVEKLLFQGREEAAFAARLAAIRLSVMIKDQSLVDQMVYKTKGFLDNQRLTGMAVLQSNGLSATGRDEKLHELDLLNQLGLAEIHNAQ
ncbi:hypothetical protein IID23_02970 [Patescibacteria group bacterium]|nr:hypothetical protein [Patescibacteria group bacterium]